MLSCGCSGVAQHAADAFRQTRPRLALRLELLLAFGSELVETRLAVLLGRAPGRLEQAVLLHAMQGRVEGAFLHAQQLGGHLVDVRGDRVAVQLSAARERAEDEEAE